MELVVKDGIRNPRRVAALEDSHKVICAFGLQQVSGHGGLDELLYIVLSRLLNGRHIFEIFFHE
jgi:hypothetical protein